ncbi:MAG: cytochrome d ubiquinol oxidase subunit II [Treponema sp. GWA1_62_8]|nr:MAG: cytochrome d ubiquinol oxidase subunit II [Treponema sp. GWA1_62_8]OHE69484.1 MAG: cytochrome d ubiquinol oxidase subunit II [Treponema sp. GWC1_61_84]
MLPHDILAILWYVVLAVAWCAYLVQESFIVGSGMLQRIGHGPAKQRSIQISGGLHYDGIEVWLITAVGGTFAAFPPVFAMILESLYVPFFLLIAALIVRVVSIEMMYKDESSAWRKAMSIAWGISSLLIPLVLGVYFANVFRGLAIDQGGYHGFILELFDVIGLAGGVFFTANSLVTGWCWIRFTTIPEDAGETASTAIPTIASIAQSLALIVLFLGLNNKSALFASGLFAKAPALWAVPVLAVLSSGATVLASRSGKTTLQFTGGIATMLLAMASLFAAAFPKMVVSSIDPSFGIDVMAGASSRLTLSIMTYVAAVFLPIVLLYQAWKYVRFSKDKNGEA